MDGYTPHEADYIDLFDTLEYLSEATPQVKSDWNEKNREKPSFIDNKPEIPIPIDVTKLVTYKGAINDLDLNSKILRFKNDYGDGYFSRNKVRASDIQFDYFDDATRYHSNFAFNESRMQSLNYTTGINERETLRTNEGYSAVLFHPSGSGNAQYSSDLTSFGLRFIHVKTDDIEGTGALDVIYVDISKDRIVFGQTGFKSVYIKPSKVAKVTSSDSIDLFFPEKSGTIALVPETINTAIPQTSLMLNTSYPLDSNPIGTQVINLNATERYTYTRVSNVIWRKSELMTNI
ncbi:hypothetical protein [Tenacibaculum finnmarkense]|uniref:hypothetical protein n=1 Tax=Tenacibaculum finnmarkense TaxID=2781243 RepID=UPI0011AF6C4A|nr:hypothetical protein [Tenacibaculum finnmarkense]MCD8440741.1 hypothetical protein [Tenacibaculum finnmarkense genomovar ulcerans]MCG8208293.1 hypothetical protein [Tenacibaculum finnmarkense genomovar finnmarkense]MCG8721631.1 hypothetical protein [Tenacibaculum finnmarkense]MCM8907421.1 hypothetical protein [Tenacibaculum finnmarkense genomovar finnmarkense]